MFKRLVLLFWCVLVGAAVYGGESPKYIFLFIGDGMSQPQRNLAENFLKKTQGADKELLINHFPVKASTRTGSANALVTDSAAAGTAIACGEKTLNGVIGLAADRTRPLESSAALAKKLGRRVGIVTSVTINHATPAAFYGHRANRGQYYNLGLDLIASGFDYFGGGGCSSHNDQKNPAYKGSIYDLARAAGYTVTKTRKEFEALRPGVGKVMARGADGALPAVIERDTAAIGLDELVSKGIELLDGPDGFFMMCEGGAIDWRGHSNDPGGSVHETLALDKAVRVAYTFALKHPKETLIVVTGDHETGGLTLGFANTGYTDKTELLARQTCTADRLDSLLRAQFRKNPGKETFETCAMPVITQVFGLTFAGEGDLVVRPAERAELEKAFQRSLDGWKKNDKKSQTALKIAALKVFNAHCGISWNTTNHSALPVITTAYGIGAERFAGEYENTHISLTLKDLLRGN